MISILSKKINPTTEVFPFKSSHYSNPQEKQVDIWTNFVENERKQKKDSEVQRNKIYEDIIKNESITRYVYRFLLFGILGGTTLGLFCTSTITLLPCHNVINEPHYWYEFLIHVVFGYLPLFAAESILKVSSWMNTECVKTMINFLILYFVGVAFSTISISAIYGGWSYICEYPYPMPFQGILLASEILAITYILLWFQFPKYLRRDKCFRKRMKYAFHALLFSGAIPLQYQVIVILFGKVPLQYQWAISLVLPMLREINLAISLKMTQSASETKAWPVVCSVTHYMSARHVLFITIIIGNVATHEASLCILAIDFIINMYLCLKLVYLRRNKPEQLQDQIILIQGLVLNEHVEFVMPIAYLCCFVAAYYGPNGELIGNIKYGNWRFKAVTEVDLFYRNITELFLIDLSSAIICTIILWMACKINLLRAYYQLLKDHWQEMAVQTAFLLEFVSTFMTYHKYLNTVK